MASLLLRRRTNTDTHKHPTSEARHGGVGDGDVCGIRCSDTNAAPVLEADAFHVDVAHAIHDDSVATNADSNLASRRQLAVVRWDEVQHARVCVDKEFARCVQFCQQVERKPPAQQVGVVTTHNETREREREREVERESLRVRVCVCMEEQGKFSCVTGVQASWRKKHTTNLALGLKP